MKRKKTSYIAIAMFVLAAVIYVSLYSSDREKLVSSQGSSDNNISDDRSAEYKAEPTSALNDVDKNSTGNLDGDFSNGVAAVTTEMSSIDIALIEIPDEVKSDIQTSLGLDDFMIEELSGAIEQKIRNNHVTLSLMASITSEPEQAALLLAEEYSLTQEQVEQREKLLTQINSFEKQLESERASFEDEVNNLLSYEQKQKLRSFEEKRFRSETGEHIDRMVGRLKSPSLSLTDQQTLEAEYIAQKYKDYDFSQIPIGATLQAGGGSSNAQIREVKTTFGMDILAILTPEQKRELWRVNE